MQVEQLEAKGIFRQAKVSGAGHGEAGAVKAAQTGAEPVIVGGSAPQTQQVTYEKPQQEQTPAVFEEIRKSASTKDATLSRNEMLFGVRHTRTDDVAQMEEDGFSLPDMETHAIVTETDKIQAQRAKAGKDTSYFTGELSAEQIEQMTGSAALAAQYERTVEQAAALEPLSEGTMKYLLDNELEPTVENLYLAQYNSSGIAVSQPDASLDEAVVSGQIAQVAAAAGIEPTEENLAAGRWLAANEIPVTAENYRYVCELRTLELPPTEETLHAAIAQALTAGEEPTQALLCEALTPAARAEEALTVIEQTTDAELSYVLEQGSELTIENLRAAHEHVLAGEVPETADDAETDAEVSDARGLRLIEARRRLEETRLVMTVEANYRLIKKGIAIDTQPLQQLVGELRAQERDYYKNLLESDGTPATETQVSTFQETIETAEQLKWMPAYALGSEAYEGTAESLHAVGGAMQGRLAAAGEAYETLMTEPRADLGDSIGKAFRNVDDILQDIGMEPTQGNQRAVRILAYNHTEITQESVLRMKLADQEVQQAFDSLKPAIVREMIRDGKNPLQMSLSELNEQAAQLRERIGGVNEQEKYSEYLWKLEQKQELTPQERESYIGIFRLIHQVEAGDGAAIGALVEQGAEFTMGNLLSAVRSRKKGGMDYQVDDSFGGVQSVRRGTSITEQIDAAFQTECFREVQKVAQEPEQFAELLQQGDAWKELTPEQLLEKLRQIPADTETDRAYSEEQLRQLAAAAEAAPQVYEMLDTYQIPVTVTHVLAMQQMLASPNDALRRFFGMADELEQSDADDKDVLMDEIAKIKEDIMHRFGEHVQTPEELADAQETLADVAEHCGQTILYEGMSRQNVMQAQMMIAQLHLGKYMTREERYQIPVLTSDGAVGINVRIVRGSEKKGSVRITMDSRAYGKVAAQLQTDGRGVRGYFASDSRAGADRLQREQSDLNGLLGIEDAADDEPIRMIYSAHLDLTHFELSGERSAAETDAADYEWQTKELYGLAEKVVRFLQEGITKDA